MLDAVVEFLLELVCFRLGKFYLRVLTLGRYRFDPDKSNPVMVSAFGGFATLCLLVGLLSAANRIL